MAHHVLLKPVTVAEYLEKEQRSDIRHEYVAGHVFPLVGASGAHNRVVSNIHAFLHRHLHGTPCRPYRRDVKVRIEGAEAFYYPDIVVSCEPFDPSGLYLREPVLVVEVLSPSTGGTDRREKRLSYQKLPTLREYVLVAPDKVRVEVFRRGEGGSCSLDVYGPGDERVILTAFAAELPMMTIYAEALPG